MEEQTPHRRRIRTGVAVMAATALGLVVAVPATAQAPGFRLVEDNPTCQDIQPAGEEWAEFKIDPPSDGPHTDGTLAVNITLGQIGPGQVFGEMALLDDSPRSADARVHERCRLLTIPKDGFDDLLGSVLNANLAQVGVQQNSDMRRISAWVAIAAVPTAIAGIYGMNFEHMPELRWTLGYPGALLLMAVICVALYRGFKRSGWL